jgi:hypothetical protein
MNNLHKGAGDHRRAWDVIPWVVNGTASASEQQLVEAHVEQCADCRIELARQRRLQTAVAQEMPAPTDVDAGLKRLFKRIDESADHRIDAAHGSAVRRRWQGIGAIHHWLVAAVIVEAVGLSAFGVAFVLRGATEHEYQTLSDAVPTAARATILIVPAPTMQLGELQQHLQALKLTLVSGPNAVGAYTLAPYGERPNAEAQVASLRALPGMQLVEPIVAEGKSR